MAELSASEWQRRLAEFRSDLSITSVAEVRNWSESLVYRLDGTLGGRPVSHYLKQLNPRSVREGTVYALASAWPSIPAPKGQLVTTQGERWLLIESVVGSPLAKICEAESWIEAVRQLARFHDDKPSWSNAASVSELPTLEPLLNSVFPEVLRKTFALGQRWVYQDLDMRLCSEVLENLERHWPTLRTHLLAFPQTLVHGDCHAGNLFMGDDQRIAMIDWGSAFIGPGLFDVVTLIDVAQRMRRHTCQPEQLQEAYWLTLNEQTRQAYGSFERAWSTVTVLRSLLELQWFSTTGEDYGPRANRELNIIQKHLMQLNS